MANIDQKRSTEDAAALAGRLFQAALGAGELMTVHIGVRLGLYAAVSELGPVTCDKLAEQTGIHPRYAREWAEQQAVAGFLEVDEPTEAAERRRYSLSPAAREVFLDADSPHFTAPLALLTVGTAGAVPGLLDAFRSGTGIAFGDFGADVRDGHAGFNRYKYVHQMVPDWLPVVSDVHELLASGKPVRVADVGCGVGWAAVTLAKAFPSILIDGFDTDRESVDQARRHAEQEGVADRATFEVCDAARLSAVARYDLVYLFETLHELSRPVEVLACVRRACTPDGIVLVGDERVGDDFEAPGDPVQRLLYMGSVLHCLPVGMAEQPSAETGAILRPALVRDYAQRAGFAGVETLPIENPIFRFYRLSQ